MKIKRLITAALALVMAMSLTAVGFATSDAVLQDDMTGQGNLDIYGTVEPISKIDVTVPVDGLRFTIKADRTIAWQDGEIISRCPAPLSISMINSGEATLTGDEVGQYNIGGAPALAADDAYADWDNLTRAQTKAKIAISVNEENISTATADTPVALGDIASAFGIDDTGAYQANPQTLAIKGSALYGKAWDNTADLLFKYDTVIEFAMQ